jgi:hypothetical protein
VRQASSPRSINFGFGDTTRYGGTDFSATWVQGFDDDPTISVDGEIIYDSGVLSSRLTSAADRPWPAAPEVARLLDRPGGWGDRLISAIGHVANDPVLARLPRQVHDISIDGTLVFSVTTGDGPAQIGRRVGSRALLRSDHLLATSEAFDRLAVGEAFTSLLATGDMRLAARLYAGSSLTTLLIKALTTMK